MRGDKADMESRLRLTLPDRWFADAPPILSGLVAGLGCAWAGLYLLLGFVRRQCRLATATDRFLDAASRDFFGNRLPRRDGEADGPFRARIQRAMLRSRGTRAALIEASADAGYGATVFEPARPADTGAYATAGNLAWGVAGGWGSLQMPLECLVTAQRPANGDDGVLQAGLAECLPAGGVAWLRIAS